MKLILALDFSKESDALQFVDKLDPNLCALKVGLEMYTWFGPSFVKKLIKRQFKIFLDLKFHDIPNTVAKACVAAADLGVWMLNVHASGGLTMMRAARAVLEPYGYERPLLIAVTVLTSFADSDLVEIGVQPSLSKQIDQLALLTKNAGLDGVVCSAFEVPSIKSCCGSAFITVTPGIRMPDDAADDQVRLATPGQALNLGSNYLVLGRTITQAVQPVQRLHEILKCMPTI